MRTGDTAYSAVPSTASRTTDHPTPGLWTTASRCACVLPLDLGDPLPGDVGPLRLDPAGAQAVDHDAAEVHVAHGAQHVPSIGRERHQPVSTGAPPQLGSLPEQPPAVRVSGEPPDQVAARGDVGEIPEGRQRDRLTRTADRHRRRLPPVDVQRGSVEGDRILVVAAAVRQPGRAGAQAAVGVLLHEVALVVEPGDQTAVRRRDQREVAQLRQLVGAVGLAVEQLDREPTLRAVAVDDHVVVRREQGRRLGEGPVAPVGSHQPPVAAAEDRVLREGVGQPRRFPGRQRRRVQQRRPLRRSRRRSRRGRGGRGRGRGRGRCRGPGFRIATGLTLATGEQQEKEPGKGREATVHGGGTRLRVRWLSLAIVRP